MAGRDALRIPPKDNVNACAMSPTSISLAICQTMVPSLGTYLMFWNIMDTIYYHQKLYIRRQIPNSRPIEGAGRKRK